MTRSFGSAWGTGLTYPNLREGEPRSLEEWRTRHTHNHATYHAELPIFILNQSDVCNRRLGYKRGGIRNMEHQYRDAKKGVSIFHSAIHGKTWYLILENVKMLIAANLYVELCT